MSSLRKITPHEQYTLPYADSIDTFNHLPFCPSRILPPLRLRIPDPSDLGEVSILPTQLTSDTELLAWFFALLEEVCHGFGTELDKTHFFQASKENDTYLVLAALKTYRQVWQNNVRNMAISAVVEVCLSIFNMLHRYQTVNQGLSDEGRLLFAVSSEYFETIYRLFSLDALRQNNIPWQGQAALEGLPPQLIYSFDWSKQVADIISSRFLDGGKCLYTYSRISDALSLQSALYMSQIESADRDSDHTKCTLDECFGHNVNPATHITAHTRLGFTCLRIDTELDALVGILSRPSLIPVIVFEEGKELKIRIVPSTEVEAYIAISYSASQIFASPLSNSLPSCQLITLRHVVRQCSRSMVKDGRPVKSCGLWLDTLLVPVDQIRNIQREQALLKMQETFEKADVVLVIDPRLAARAGTSFDADEFMAYFICSPWFTRLWTFSESQLANALWVWYAGQPRSIDRFLENLKWPPPGHSWRTYDELGMIGHLRLYSRRIYHPSIPSKPQVPSLEHRFFDVVLENLRHRMTSMPFDEPFCLSVLMGLDTARVLSAPVELRMESFWSQVKYLSGVLLIQSGKRLTSPGFRWAPQTLLGRKAISRYGHDGDHTIRRDVIGIRVPDSYEAFKLTIVPEVNGSADGRVHPRADRLFYYVNYGYHHAQSTLDGETIPSTPKLVMSRILTGRQSPGDGTHEPFQPPGNQFIIIIRGWTGEGVNSPCAILKDEGGAIHGKSGHDSEDVVIEKNRPHILTSYLHLADFSVLTSEVEADHTAKFDLKKAFSGDMTCSDARIVCHTEQVNLHKTDIWVS